MPNELLRSLLQQLREPFTGESLFDAVGDATFFFKDECGRYLLVNHTLVQRCGVADKTKLLGRTSAEVFPAPFGAAYLAQDLQLIATCEPLLNELELHTYSTGEPGWCLTTKQPLRGKSGDCIGLVGISRDLHRPTNEYGDVAAAIHEIQRRLDYPWTVEEISRTAGLSTYRLDQRIREVFHLTTNQFVLKLRLDRARQQLVDTDKPIVRIALECGYSDQSAFTRQFRRTIGMAPGDFRRLYGGERTTSK